MENKLLSVFITIINNPRHGGVSTFEFEEPALDQRESKCVDILSAFAKWYQQYDAKKQTIDSVAIDCELTVGRGSAIMSHNVGVIHGQEAQTLDDVNQFKSSRLNHPLKATIQEEDEDNNNCNDGGIVMEDANQDVTMAQCSRIMARQNAMERWVNKRYKNKWRDITKTKRRTVRT
ncbi:hypothetical protein SAMD00019534_126210, partial [Acytostelium subglobosum LB1]|uniref:hypothetical protein n=1 Tax=Acytostelium subglobosum LB1 TaxID=1410327 RepID=UPI000644B217